MLPVLPDEPNRPDRPAVPADMRISDAERDQVIGLLRGHCADGRLTLDEFGDRVTEVLDAKTVGDLELVTRQLPVVLPASSMTQVPSSDQPVRQRAVTRWAVAVLSGHSQKGRWRLREKMNAVAVMGGCELDLR